MAYPANIAFTFATQTGPIPLSELDTNFLNLQQSLNGLGNGTSVLSSVTITGGSISSTSLSNVTITAPSVTGGTFANIGGVSSQNLSDTILPGTFLVQDTSGANLTITTNYAYASRQGKHVTYSYQIVYPSTANGGTARWGGIASFGTAISGPTQQLGSGFASNSSFVSPGILSNSSNFELFGAAGAVLNSGASTLTFTGSGVFIAQ